LQNIWQPLRDQLGPDPPGNAQPGH
jgi:hypothetical protein